MCYAPWQIQRRDNNIASKPRAIWKTCNLFIDLLSIFDGFGLHLGSQLGPTEAKKTTKGGQRDDKGGQGTPRVAKGTPREPKGAQGIQNGSKMEPMEPKLFEIEQKIELKFIKQVKAMTTKNLGAIKL